MAVPTIIELLPATGPTFGRNLISIIGTNFRLPPPLSVTGPISPRLATVRVRFGGEAALRVEVISFDLIRALVPSYRGDSFVDPIPAVALEVTNLDDAGDPISGETATLALAYTYVRPALRPPEEAFDTPWRAVVREVLRLFRRNILPGKRVSHAVHTDFAEAGASATLDASLPSLVVDGPRLRENRVWRTEEFVDTVLVGGFAERRPPHLVVDFEFGVTGLSDSDLEAFSLMSAVGELLERTYWLEVDDPTLGRLRFPLEVLQQPETFEIQSNANLRGFTALFEVRAVPIVAKEAESFAQVSGIVQLDFQPVEEGEVEGSSI